MPHIMSLLARVIAQEIEHCAGAMVAGVAVEDVVATLNDERGNASHAVLLGDIGVGIHINQHGDETSVDGRPDLDVSPHPLLHLLAWGTPRGGKVDHHRLAGPVRFGLAVGITGPPVDTALATPGRIANHQNNGKRGHGENNRQKKEIALAHAWPAYHVHGRHGSIAILRLVAKLFAHAAIIGDSTQGVKNVGQQPALGHVRTHGRRDAN